MVVHRVVTGHATLTFDIFLLKIMYGGMKFRSNIALPKKMLADYFTKPLQGSLFRKFRAIIMGWEPLSALQDIGELKERVED